MRYLQRGAFFLWPVACALALALALPAGARAQSAPPGAAAQAGQIKDLPLSAADRSRYVGNYTITLPNGTQMPFRIYEEQGVLMGQPGNEEPKRILHQGNHVFHPEGMPDFTLTFVVEGARATGFTARKGDRSHEAVRAPDVQQ